eukprot:TRINITY_DN65642_c4_g4_i1.p2 TRINITY_DN65642_c4_g4~~TRINITY_DN65642_c4_g4_i1.p2  ORF type:complete len:301 (+),score=185.87 TRINITY_DN65642_c4_g4_i1:116-1018(+)
MACGNNKTTNNNINNQQHTNRKRIQQLMMMMMMKKMTKNRSLLALLLLALVATMLVPAVVRADEEQVDVSDGGDAGADEGARVVAGDVEEEEEEEDDEDEGPLEPHPDVAARVFFPQSNEKKEFELNREIVVLVGLTNNGKEPFRVDSVRGYFQSPYDQSFYIQNFTAIEEIFTVIQPDEQATVKYAFYPDPNLEAVDFHFTAEVDYNDTTDRRYRTVFHNSTITMVDPNAGFSLVSFLSYVVGLAAVVGGAYFVVNKASASSKTTFTAADSGVRRTQIYTPKASSKQMPMRRKKSKKKN